jgi:very-short-patch-repair endonuclease
MVHPLLGERAGVRASVNSNLPRPIIFRQAGPMANIKRARQLRKKPTWAEKLMWRWLRDRRFSSYKFRRGHPVGEYYLDFFCMEARVSVELDGSGHGHPARRIRDLERTKFLETQGILELRFWNGELRRNRESVRNAIFEALQKRAPHPLPDYTRPMGGSGE